MSYFNVDRGNVWKFSVLRGNDWGFSISRGNTWKFVVGVITDRTAPVLQSLIIPADGLTIRMTYDENLDTNSVPVVSDFGIGLLAGVVVDAVAISGTVVILTLSRTILEGEVLTLGYFAGTNPIQDDYGNQAANISNQAVTNNSTVDGDVPVFQSGIIPADGLTLAMTYDEALDEGSVPAFGDFSLSGTSSVVDSVGVSGLVVTLTMDTAIFQDETVLLSYTAGANPIRDIAENNAANLVNNSTTNNSTVVVFSFNVTMAALGTFTMPTVTGYNYNYVADWGDESSSPVITTYNDANRAHQYTDSGTYTIQVTGVIESFVVGFGAIRNMIVAVNSWGVTGQFKKMNFIGCSNLLTLPSEVGKLTGMESFRDFCNACGSLTVIPTGTFDDWNKIVVNAFRQSFRDTGVTAIPPSLFDYAVGITQFAFAGTFRGCSDLVTVPTGLFEFNTAVSNDAFVNTFDGCSTLETVPALLFENTVNTGDYDSVLKNCIKLQLNRNIWFADADINTRFLNESPKFGVFVQRTSFTGNQGEAPHLWDCDYGTGTPTITNAFDGAGNSLTSISNYGDIPAGWL